MRRSPRLPTTLSIPPRISTSCSPFPPSWRCSSLPTTAPSSVVVISINRGISPSPLRWNNPGPFPLLLLLGEGGTLTPIAHAGTTAIPYYICRYMQTSIGEAICPQAPLLWRLPDQPDSCHRLERSRPCLPLMCF